jgi:hypothetical protein
LFRTLIFNSKVESLQSSVARIKALALFHHTKHNKSMKVVEKDKVISGMLRDELKRCQEMLDSLEKSVSGLPKGSMSKRKKRYMNKVYSYHYLKYREGERVISKHVPNREVQEILKKLALRKKYEKEIQSYEKKIAYLNRILRADKRRGHGNIT